MTATRRLRDLMAARRMVVAPGAYDGITARLIAQAGFPAVYMTGAGTAASLGYPDYGLLTMSEMVANAGRIAAAVEVPVISDADTGYGNELNVFRTVREFEGAGVAAIHIEDQAFPKRCGHLDDKEIVGLEDWLAKIRAAAAARRTPDFAIIARTDARAVAGFEAAIERANAALAAGADIAFVEAPQSMAEIEQVPRLVRGPCLLNLVRNGRTPEIALPEAERLGYAIAILPGVLMAGVVGICDQLLAAVRREGRHPVPPGDPSPRQLFARFGAEAWDARRTAFRPAAPRAAE